MINKEYKFESFEIESVDHTDLRDDLERTYETSDSLREVITLKEEIEYLKTKCFELEKELRKFYYILNEFQINVDLRDYLFYLRDYIFHLRDSIFKLEDKLQKNRLKKLHNAEVM